MAIPSDSFDSLVKYFGKPASAPNSLEVAKFILLNAANDLPVGKKPEHEGNEPSLMGRVFDILSRPNYMAAEFARTMGDPSSVIKAFKGERKTTFSDVLEERGVENKAVRGTVGFLLDVGLDPTTYIPGGVIAKGATKAAAALKGTKSIKGLDTSTVVARDKNLAQKLLDRGDPVHPEAFNLPTRGDQAGIPEALKPSGPEISFPRNILTPGNSSQIPKLADTLPGQLELPLENVPKNLPGTGLPEKPPVGPSVIPTASSAKGQVPFKFPDFNITNIRSTVAIDKAEDIVQKAVQGDPEAVLRVTPTPSVKVGSREQRAAAEIINTWDNSRATAQINKKFPDTINAKQQVKLWYRASNAAKKRFKNPNAPSIKNRVASDTYKIYLAAEKALEAKGLVPRIGTGENVRLSDVISQLGGPRRAQEVLDEFGSEIKEGSPTWQVIQALRASGAINEAKSVKLIAEKIQEAKVTTKASNLTSDGFQKQFDEVLKNIGTATARAEGLSAAGVNATSKLIDYVINSGKSAAQVAIEQKAKIIDNIVSTGRGTRTEVNVSVTKALESDLGKLPKWVADDNKAMEFFMGRVATWWGQRDLRPMSLNAIGSSAATAAARGHALDNLFKAFNQNQRFEAMRLAQGIGTASTPETYQLATQLKRLMDNLAGQVTGSSVVLRSAVSMDMLNKWMKKYGVGFEFTNKTAQDITGKSIDYSEGTDWLNSWKTAEIKDDPKVFIFKVQQAMEQATREKALFDEIGERFGAKTAGREYRTRIEGYDYLDGYYFPADIAKQIPRVIKDWSVVSWTPQNKALRLYDRVLSMWKSGVTIYRPAHHIRNMIGDVYLGWMDGVNSVRPYILAARVQRSMKGAYETLQDVDNLVQLGVMQRGFGTPRPNEILFKNKSGVGFTAEQIGAVAHQKGLLEHAKSLEDIIDMGETSKIRPFGGKVQKVARGASELQNHNARLAHFIDKVIKSRGSNLEEIFEQASRRARKWHPSGLDLTEFERKYMRRIIPFYTWMRKSLPLLAEGLVMNPGKTVIPAKMYDAIQEMQGIDTPGRHDPFPVDQMFPEWIRAQGVGPISGPDGFLGSFSDQMPPGYTMGGVGLNPLTELITQVESPGRTLASSLTPAVGVPIQLMTGRKLFTGEPISGTDARPGAMEQFIGEQIPIYSGIQSMTGMTPFGTETKKAVRSDDAGTEALVNWLSGAGIKGTGPYINQAIYEHNAPMKAQRKAGRDEFLKQLRQALEEG